jgi:queuosine precursor transporter
MHKLILPILAMVGVVVSSNFLVQYPLEGTLAGVNLGDWLTWGAFTYPAAFLVTDLTNRAFGVSLTRRVVYAGFAAGVVLSLALATPRIALASGTAFLLGQLLDVTVFNWMRRMSWWKAPFIGTVLGSIVDTSVFFSIAFAATGLPWGQWALGDFAAKITMALLFLAPYRALMNVIRPVPQPSLT